MIELIGPIAACCTPAGKASRAVVKRLLQRQRDELLDFFRRHAAGLDLQGDLRAVEAGEDVDRGARQRQRAGDHHRQRQGQDQQAVLQAAVYE
jgi:hypothetical protein